MESDPGFHDNYDTPSGFSLCTLFILLYTDIMHFIFYSLLKQTIPLPLLYHLFPPMKDLLENNNTTRVHGSSSYKRSNH